MSKITPIRHPRESGDPGATRTDSARGTPGSPLSRGRRWFFYRALRALCVTLLLLASGAGARAEELTFAMRIERGVLPATMRIVRVKQGDVVHLRWTSDQAGVLHIHGYEIERQLEPGRMTEVTIAARATGRFPIHLHGKAHDETTLAYLEVYPR